MQKSESARNILATAKFLLPSLTPAEKKVAEFLIAYPKEVTGMSLQKMAKRQKPMLINFCGGNL